MELLNNANFGTISQCILFTYCLMFMILLPMKDEFYNAYELENGEVDYKKFINGYIILFLISPVVVLLFTAMNLYSMFHMVLFKKESKLINELEGGSKDEDDNE